MTRTPPAPGAPELPDDPDPAPSVPSAPSAPSAGPAVVAVSLGGVIGALSRYQVGRSWPVPTVGFPWSTFVVNVSGCLLIGLLLTVLIGRPAASPLLRPFLGTGVLGGYTTFSTYTVDLHRLFTSGHPATAALYLLGTLAAALAATAAGMAVAWRAVTR